MAALVPPARMALRQPLRAASVRISLTIKPRAISIMPIAKNTSSGASTANSTTARARRRRRSRWTGTSMISSQSFTAEGVLAADVSVQEARHRQPRHVRHRNRDDYRKVIIGLGGRGVGHDAIDLDR